MSAVETSLKENEHVKGLLKILSENDLKADAQGLTEVVNLFTAMERDLNKTVSEINTMRLELSALREESGHPIKTMLQNAADGLAEKLKSIQKCLVSLKDKIIGACKRAVEAFKDGGIAALNGAMTFFDVKHELEDTRQKINNAIDYNNKKIAKIEAASAEMHSAGRSIKNIGRVIQGKEPIPDIKPNGKLAYFIETPFRMENKRFNRSLGNVNKFLVRIDKLEKAAAQRAERDRPSTLEAIRETKAQVAEQKRETPVKTKVVGAEI